MYGNYIVMFGMLIGYAIIIVHIINVLRILSSKKQVGDKIISLLANLFLSMVSIELIGIQLEPKTITVDINGNLEQHGPNTIDYIINIITIIFNIGYLIYTIKLHKNIKKEGENKCQE